MIPHLVRWSVLVALLLAISPALGEDWKQFRGPKMQGISEEKGVPVEWSDKENIVWRAKLPGPGSASPIEVGDRIFLTCYSGYGVEQGEGKVSDLVRHVLCVDRKNGAIVWDKEFPAEQPEEAYRGYEVQHGYASSTLASDGKRLYVFFGKSGVFCLDLNGEQVWHKSVGEKTHNWGSGTSPVLYKDLVFINASVESGSLIALNKETGAEVWRAKGISQSWNTPQLVDVPGGGKELVIGASKGGYKMLAYDPDTGNPLWYASCYAWYICPTVVAHNGIVYGMDGRSCAAVRAGGKGDVTETNVVWKKDFGTTVPSAILHDGSLYMATSGSLVCLNAEDGKEIYKGSFKPGSGIVYASPLLVDGKLYIVSQKNGTYVVAAGSKFEQLAHNVFADDHSRTNGSPIVSHGCLLLRTDRYLYCIGKKG